MHRRLAVSTALAAGAFTLLAACGASSSGGANDSSSPPKSEFAGAVHSLSDGSALTTTLSLDTTAHSLRHLSKQGGGKGLTAAQAGLLAAAHIAIEVTAPDGKTLHDVVATGAYSGAAGSVIGTSGDTTYFDIREVNKTLYLQVDLKDILGVAGEASQYQTLVTRASSLPRFVQAFVAGKPVAVANSTLSALVALVKGSAQGSGVGSIPNFAQLISLAKSLASTVLGDLTVTRTSAGATGQLAMTGNLRSIARDVLSTASTGLPAIASQISPGSANKVPDQDLKATASVSGGALSTLNIDVGQFSTQHHFTLPVVATFSKSGPAIAAPTVATLASLQDLVAFATAISGSS